MTKKKIKKAAALSYDHANDHAPKVIAKGCGKIADKIVALANAYEIPLVADPNLVQMLEALDVDTEIPAELYKAVAEVLVFIYRLNEQK